MRYDQGNPEELRGKFWKGMAASPYVMLELEGDAVGAVPMTAQLDEDAHHQIWFFAARDGHFAPGGAARATFVSKGHDVYAQFSGTLVEEHDRARLDKQWNNFVEAWFPAGKDDPNLLMLRMELGDASIWAGEVGALNTVKMALGIDVTNTIKGGYAKTRL